MPSNKSKARGPRTNRKKNAPRKGNRRAPPVNNHFTSIVITTLQLKQAHKKEEIYPLSLGNLISRANVGADADIRLVGYSMSVALATGNDCSTVSMNIAHEGPWIRRSTSTDVFNQVCTEHTVRGKSLLFKKKVLASTEREYINPDDLQNTIDLRVRDPCGVIPGVVLKIEFRAHIIRRVPATTFANANDNATDRYEDQDVSAGASPGPTPPTAIKHVPAVIVDEEHLRHRTYTDGRPVNGKFEYYEDRQTHMSFTVDVTVPQQTVSGVFSASTYTNQSAFNSAGYDGTFTRV